MKLLFDDLTAGLLTRPTGGHDREALNDLVRSRQPDAVDYRGWQAIDAAERTRGKAQGRPRTKISDILSMLEIANEQARTRT